jgi:alpha-tubulin suppressor-like RCC1 family protein
MVNSYKKGRLGYPEVPQGRFFVYVSSHTHSVALDQYGNAWATGDNSSGQLGDNTYIGKCCWVPVCCNYTYCMICAGNGHTVALKTDGTAVAWGRNNCGQLGDGTISGSPVPVAVCCNYTYKQVVAGSTESYGLKTDNTLVSWGSNFYGQLGDDTKTAKCQPVAVCCNYEYKQVEAGSSMVAALNTSGCLFIFGIVGYDTGCADYILSKKPLLSDCSGDIVKIAHGSDHGLFLTNTNDMYSWGFNGNGQLGNGHKCVSCWCDEATVLGNHKYKDISAGTYISAGIKTDDTLVTWGVNYDGRLGDGTTVDKCQPVAVCCNYKYKQVALGWGGVLGIKLNYVKTLAWGDNSEGQLGICNKVDKCQPVETCIPT